MWGVVTQLDWPRSSRPDILLVDTATAHALHYLLGLLFRHATFLLDDLRDDVVDFSCHVGGVAADVEVCLLQQQVVDELAVGLDVVLDVVFLLCVFSGEGVEDAQFVAEGGFVGLG